MSSNKKRKIEVTHATPMLSAAALRRRLLERQASASPAESSDNGLTSPVNGLRSPISNGTGPKTKATPKASVKMEVARTSEEVLLGDSGTVDETALYEATETPDEAPRKSIQLSSVPPSSSNIQTKEDGMAVLKFPVSSERIVILGSYGVKVKTGEASICGASLYPTDAMQWVHAPHCHALPVLRCSEKSTVEIHPHPGAHHLRSLEKLSPVFGNLWNEATTGERQTWQMLGSSADGPKKAMLQDLKSPAIWNREIAKFVKSASGKAPILFVCGPKSSGKSTFCRIVTNRLVTERGGTKKRVWPGVAVLDIDPGQPEFGPPGVISLVKLDEPNLSPPFCHPMPTDKHLLKSHAVAAITPASNIEHYKSCVLDMVSHYRSTCPNYPLIINTPGWIQGSGLVLLQDLITGIRPTEILYMSEDGPEDTVEGLKSSAKNTTFTTLPSQSSDFTSRTALHLRHMQAMSYFHANPEKNTNTNLRWDSLPLAHIAPWQVDYAGDDPGMLGIIYNGYQPEPELLPEAIDGTILAIVELKNTTKALNGQNIKDLTCQTPSQIPYIRSDIPLNPAHSRCLGLALIRGVDTAAKRLALSTPLAADQLGGKKIVLVGGKFDTPTWAYTEDHYHRAAASKRSEDDVVAEEEEIPWTEKLHGSQKRAVGSQVWRVRRDLGRNNSAGGD